MSALIGFVTSENQINIKKLNLSNQEIESKMVDTIELKDYSFNLLLTTDEEELDAIEASLKNELKFYPIVSSNQVGVSKELFNQMDFESLFNLYNKINARWVLNNNISTIEQSYATINYLKDLYINDRDNFFEELWFLLKSNLATTELTIVFHDLKTSADKEKNEKPQLAYSFISGSKIPNLQPATEKEEMLMKEYQNEFGDFFNITEYSPEKGFLVATAKINLSPILIMARLNSFNQLQQSILIAIFSGLQAE